jgi:hypothetical protein
VFLGRGSGLERAEIAAFSGFGIFLSRIEAVLTGFQLPNHVLTLRTKNFRTQDGGVAAAITVLKI